MAVVSGCVASDVSFVFDEYLFLWPIHWGKTGKAFLCDGSSLSP